MYWLQFQCCLSLCAWLHQVAFSAVSAPSIKAGRCRQSPGLLWKLTPLTSPLPPPPMLPTSPGQTPPTEPVKSSTVSSLPGSFSYSQPEDPPPSGEEAPSWSHTLFLPKILLIYILVHSISLCTLGFSKTQDMLRLFLLLVSSPFSWRQWCSEATGIEGREAAQRQKGERF